MVEPIVDEVEAKAALRWARQGLADDATPESRMRGRVELARVDVWLDDPAVSVAGALRLLATRVQTLDADVSAHAAADQVAAPATAAAIEVYVRRGQRAEAVTGLLGNRFLQGILVAIGTAVAAKLGLPIIQGPPTAGAP